MVRDGDRASCLQGSMYTDVIERYDDVYRQLTSWLHEGQLTYLEYVLHSIEYAASRSATVLPEELRQNRRRGIKLSCSAWRSDRT